MGEVAVGDQLVGADGLPDDDSQLRRITGLDNKTWKASRGTVLDYFELNGDRRWVHGRVQKTLFQIAQKQEQNRDKALKRWMAHAGINKHITWHCARLSFSILLQDANVDTATVALMLGHTTTKFVHETYKRHRPKDQSVNLAKLPQAVW